MPPMKRPNPVQDTEHPQKKLQTAQLEYGESVSDVDTNRLNDMWASH